MTKGIRRPFHEYFSLKRKPLAESQTFELTDKLKTDVVFFTQDASKVQDVLAPRLRAMAVRHLATSDTAAAKSFRGEYLQVANENYKKYLKKQAQKGTWGSDIEAIALGEELHCNIVVTSIHKDRANATFCLHCESADAPTIHLYNDNNYHWTNDPRSHTKGGGDCLYHAVAKALQRLIIPHKLPSAYTSHAIFQRDSLEKEAIKKQVMINDAIQSAIQRKQTPAEKEQEYEQEKSRILKLPKAEQEQIANDYLFALELALNAEPEDQDPNYDDATRLKFQ